MGASDELDDVLDGLRAFLRSEVDTRHEQHAAVLDHPHRSHRADGRYHDDALRLMREVRTASAAAGYYSMLSPTSVGGAGLGYEALYRSWEVIFRHCGSRRWLGWYALAHWTKGPSPVLAHLPERVRERYLPSLISGEHTMCFAMSEPDAGSDAWRMRTRAARVDGGWAISGEKQWISNAAHAEYAVVFAVDDPEAASRRSGGVTAFFVPVDSVGFTVTSVIPMFGHAGSNEGIIQMQDVFVPDDHVIGEVGRGFPIAMAGVSLGRLYNAAKGVGLGRWALQQACDYAQEREAFGTHLSSFQGVTFPLAQSASELHAAWLVGLDCARRLDAGTGGRTELSMAKLLSTELGLQAVDRSMQAHGAMGFTNELGLAEAWQQLRAVCVADGSSEVLKRQIWQSVAHDGVVV
ncbi:MAG: acyl-CoA/acyl-ACP dehydrogenase [Actinobacteria bacterium]|nr:acyl-CoA/acyl-ACP dehydrogenase [Actinomycetota bacterium]